MGAELARVAAAAIEWSPRRVRAGLAKLYRTLGIDADALADTPPLAPRIQHLCDALWEHDPTLPTSALNLDPLYYLRLSLDPDAARLVRLHDRVREPLRRHVPIEALALALNIPPARILEIVIATIKRTACEVDTVITALSHTRVLAETVQSALIRGPDGHADRTNMHKAMGWLPMPRGSVTNISVAANAQAAAPVAVVAAPTPEKTIRTLAEKFQADRAALPPAAPGEEVPSAGVPVDVEVDAADYDEDDE